ncbi:MAG TPA: hypothetical protein VN641_03280, partial [Urbifossiella sp.]|nr:hypothetical protein [Urbifossiella sp.]
SASDRRAMLGVHSVDHSCGNVTLFTAQFLGRSIVMQATHPKAGFRPQAASIGSSRKSMRDRQLRQNWKVNDGRAAARGEAKKVAKGTGIMALTANARLPRNKRSGLQFLIAAKDRGFPQRGGC